MPNDLVRSEDSGPSDYRVLVVVASKHGSTHEIAEKISAVLHKEGYLVHVFQATKAPKPSKFDAAIIGSSIYAGNWLKEAKDYIYRYKNEFASLPVWLFSSGPVGDKPQPESNQIMHLDEYRTITNCVEHKIFTGKIDADKLNVAERLMVRTFKIPYGDYRNWDEISAWATNIARALRAHRKATAELL